MTKPQISSAMEIWGERQAPLSLSGKAIAMMEELPGSPVKIYRLHRLAAPMGGVIAMLEDRAVATCIRRSAECWRAYVGERHIATFPGNATSAALFLHGLFMNPYPPADIEDRWPRIPPDDEDKR